MVAFHPIIQKWFAERYGKPTDIQALAWPRIALGQHLLITAPTGSGKTLTAFLWALNRFATGDLATGKTRILYISPLKALNNDIRKNLIDPLTELRSLFDAADTPFPDINVATRSGDTAASERSRMLRKPPEILITTPESLNLLLSSRGGKNLLYDIDTLILDEIHAVVDSKRGVYFMYMTDTPKATKTSNLREDLLQEVVFSAGLRPSITLALVVHFVNQRQRLLPGHRPEDSDDLEDWIKERSLLPISEWQGLIDELSFTVSDNRFLTLKNGQLIVSKDVGDTGLPDFLPKRGGQVIGDQSGFVQEPGTLWYLVQGTMRQGSRLISVAKIIPGDAPHGTQW